MAMEVNAKSLSVLRGESISIHRAFAGMHPLIQRTSRLSINAVVSASHLGGRGAAFAVVAQELQVMAQELANQVGQIEEIFRAVVGEVADWVRSERQIALLEQSETLIRRLSAGNNGAGPDAQDGGPPALPGNAPRQLGAGGGTPFALVPRAEEPDTPVPRPPPERENPAVALVHRQSGQCRLMIRGNVERLGACIRRMDNQIDRINKVAVRQSHFTAIAARIEAAKLDGAGTDLTSVAMDIRQLADDIAYTEHAAKNSILALKSMMHKTAGTVLAGSAQPARE